MRFLVLVHGAIVDLVEVVADVLRGRGCVDRSVPTARAERVERGGDDPFATFGGRDRVERRSRPSAAGSFDLGDDLLGRSRRTTGTVDLPAEVVDHDGRAPACQLECIR